MILQLSFVGLNRDKIGISEDIYAKLKWIGRANQGDPLPIKGDQT
jgi:hypothetical protein